jgi:tRNA nucleotidyltransferase (CCA-adding enzyme)
MTEETFNPHDRQKLTENTWKKFKRISQKMGVDVASRGWVGSQADREWLKNKVKKDVTAGFRREPRTETIEENGLEVYRIWLDQEFVDLVFPAGVPPALVPMGVARWA